MQTSGKVYDVYDDQGALLKGEPPSELVKTGQLLTQDQLASLPNSVFALVAPTPDGGVLRKYACIDPGNTELALRYFSKIASSLPDGVRECIAENLQTAARWYGLEEAPFTKEALLGMSMRSPVSSVMRGLTIHDLATNVPRNVKANMEAIKTLEGSGSVVAPEQVHALKTGSERVYGVLKSNAKTDYGPAPKPPQAKLSPIPEKKDVVVEKRAYALPSVSRYPLNTWGDLVKAGEYFEEFARAFTPAERREFALSFVKQAGALGYSDIPEQIQAYAGSTYVDRREIKMAMDARQRYVSDPEQRTAFESDLNKLLSHKDLLSAEKFASVLERFDEQYGVTSLYDRILPDPYLSVLAPMKLASSEASEWTWVDGPHYVTGERLRAVASAHFAALKKHYGEEFAKEFQQDPVGTFRSLPLPHKRVIANFTSQQSADLV